MMDLDGQIFGSNVSLPCLPGLESGCEEEILSLLKEVDYEFRRKHHELLEELLNARTLCKAQRDEIDRLSRVLSNVQNEDLIEKVKQYSTEVEKLTKETGRLKSENNAFQYQLESLKRSLSIQQNENKVLSEKLQKSDEQYQSLKRIVNNLTSSRLSDGIYNERNQGDVYATSTKEAEITEAAEKFSSEEKDVCDDFISKINQEIENFDKMFRKEIT